MLVLVGVGVGVLGGSINLRGGDGVVHREKYEKPQSGALAGPGCTIFK